MIRAIGQGEVRGRIVRLNGTEAELRLNYRVNGRSVKLGRLKGTAETIERVLDGDFSLPKHHTLARPMLARYISRTGAGKTAENVAYFALEEFPPIFDYGEFGDDFTPLSSEELREMSVRELNSEGFRSFYFHRSRIAEIAPQIIERGVRSRDEAMEMREMLSAYESAREIRSTIAFANKGMVAEVAMKFPGPYLTFAERMSAGFRALMRAVDMFNSSKGYRFSTYAYIAIQHELGKEIASEKETREERLGHLKSAWKNELAARWENVERAVDVRLVMDALNSRSSRRYGLGNRERKILSLYFGLNGDSPHTLEEIGKLHGISKERVRQLLNRALRSVRVSLKAGAC